MPPGTGGTPAAVGSTHPVSSERAPPPTGKALGKASQVTSRHPLSFRDPLTGDPGVVVKLPDGSLAAFDAVCTHAGCTVEWDIGSDISSARATERRSIRRRMRPSSRDPRINRWRSFRSASTRRPGRSPCAVDCGQSSVSSWSAPVGPRRCRRRGGPGRKPRGCPRGGRSPIVPGPDPLPVDRGDSPGRT